QGAERRRSEEFFLGEKMHLARAGTTHEGRIPEGNVVRRHDQAARPGDQLGAGHGPARYGSQHRPHAKADDTIVRAHSNSQMSLALVRATASNRSREPEPATWFRRDPRFSTQPSAALGASGQPGWVRTASMTDSTCSSMSIPEVSTRADPSGA